MNNMFRLFAVGLYVLLSTSASFAAPEVAGKATTEQEIKPTKLTDASKPELINKPAEISRPEVAIDNAISSLSDEEKKKAEKKKIEEKKAVEAKKPAVPSEAIEKNYKEEKKKAAKKKRKYKQHKMKKYIR